MCKGLTSEHLGLPQRDGDHEGKGSDAVGDERKPGLEAVAYPEPARAGVSLRWEAGSHTVVARRGRGGEVVRGEVARGRRSVGEGGREGGMGREGS
jgi:hypothetical protein